MRCLCETWNSKFSKEKYHNLDTMIIEECHKLVNVFNCDTAKIFQDLVSLTVKNCKSMEAIFDLAGAEQDADYKAKLQDIHLEMLPKLEHVFKLKKGQGVLKLNNIRKIWLQDCERLENIFPFDVATAVSKNLEYLLAWDCSQLREIVAKREEANNNMTTFEFSELATIKFLVLPKFKSFYAGDVELRFPKLKDLSVENCDMLEPFKETTTNNLAKCLFPGKVINKLKSMQIESRHATLSSSAGIEYIKENLEEVHMSGIWNIEVLYSFLHRCPSLKSLWLNDCSFPVLVPHERFAEIESLGVVPRLKSLNLTNLDWLMEIGFERDAILQRIESLILKNCRCLDTIASSSVSFSHLTELEVVDCFMLRYIMSPSTAKSLVQLNTMKIINCYYLEDIVSKQIREEENASKLSIVFSQLKTLELVSLENLKSFCRSKTCAFEFPSLEKFVVSGCPMLENFSEESDTPTILQKVYTSVHGKENKWCWRGSLQATIKYIFQEKKFYEGMVRRIVSDNQELKEVWQRKEDPLKDRFYGLKTLTLFQTTYAIPTNVLRRLKSLEELKVSSCSDITVIFEFDMNDTKIGETQLPLKKLTLESLKKVTHVWQQEEEGKQGILSFKNLQHVTVFSCDTLQSLFPAALARDLKMLEKLEVSYCDDLLQIVGNEEEATDGPLVLPRLTKLELKSLRELTCFYSETLRCPELDYLDVRYCPELDPMKLYEDGQRKRGPSKDWFYSLKTLKLCACKFETTYAIPSNVLPRLKSLQELEVSDCSDIIFIFEMNVVEKNHRGQQEEEDKEGILSFKNLQRMTVYRCGKLQTMFPVALARDLKMLEKLEVKDCNELAQIVGNEEEAADGPLVLPRLTSLMLDLLPNLNCFYSGGFTVECSKLDYLEVRSCNKLKLFCEDEGCSSTSIIRLSTIKTLCLGLKDDPQVWWGQLKDQDLQNLSELFLNLEGYKNDNFTIHSEKMAPNLEKMQIRNCIWLKEISLEGMLGHLKRLELFKLGQLHSMDVLKYLPKLQELRVSWCQGLTTLVHPLAAEKLTYLEELYVYRCKSMEKIVERGQDETAVQEIKFERLQRISLEHLSSLECFYGGSAKLHLPALIQVGIEECPNMKSFSRHDMVPPSSLIQVSYKLHDESEFDELVFHRNLNVVLELLGEQVSRKECLLLGHGDYPAVLRGIWLGEVQIPLGWCFANVGYLEVEGCEFLSNTILPSHILPLLNNLQELVVRKCDSVGTIFDVKDTIPNDSNMTVIPLRRLTLEQLPGLMHVWNEDPKGRMWLPDLEDVIVSECESLKSLFPASVARDNLQILDVRKCGELVEIVAKDEAAANQKLDMFPMLTSLTLLDLPKLRCIASGIMDTLEWPNLKRLDVYGCQMLTIFATDHSTTGKYNIISAEKVSSNLERLSLNKEDVILIEKGLLHMDLQNIKFLRLCGFRENSDAFPSAFFSKVSLPNMREFAVASCTFKEIFHSQILLAMDYTEILSRLTAMELSSLPKPESIGFEQTWMAPLLEKITVLQVLACTYLTNLVPSTTTVCFSSLTQLNVKDCVGLKYLFTTSTAKSLVKLKKMFITNCESLQAVVHMAEQGDNPPYESVEFPKLSDLSLKNLPKLESFYKGKGTNVEASTVSFSGLVKLNVEDCGTLKYLFTSSSAKSLVELEKMSITNCESLEAVVHMAEQGDNPDELVEFPKLSYLSLEKLPKLVSFYKGKGANLEPSAVSFSSLTKMNVGDCGALKYLFTFSTAKSLLELTKMSITNCKLLEAVIYMAENRDSIDEVVEFPKLSYLSLVKLPKLESFSTGNLTLKFPCYSDFSVEITQCKSMKTFSSGNEEPLEPWQELKIDGVKQLKVDLNSAVKRSYDYLNSLVDE